MALTTQEEALVRQLIAENAELLNLAANEATIISKLGANKKNIGQLDSAASLSNTDVAVVRQGTADKQMALSLLKAFAKPDQATETTTGVIELATSAEVQAGTDTSRSITPAGLSSRVATETVAGLIEIATSAEAQAFTSSKAIDGAKLADAFKGSNYNLSASGYQKLPSGLIIQWGSATAGTVTFPIAFPNSVLSLTFGSSGGDGVPRYNTLTTASFGYDSAQSAGTNAKYIAIGY